jgi:hypothetical protein
MKSRRLMLITSVALIVAAAACSVLKKENSEKDIRVFLSTFQSSLSAPDEQILRYFESKQSREAILAAIRILQNKEHEFITCTAAFDEATITVEDNGINVVVAASFKSKDLDHDYDGASSLTLTLKSKNGSFVITQLHAEEFYKAFADIRNGMEWNVERKLEMRKREPIYALAKVLQTSYDSIVWYTIYKGQRYFYAVKDGDWVGYTTRYEKRLGDPNCKMGLIDDEGKVVVPLEYDLVGTPGFSFPDIVEVKKDGRIGYYSLAAEELVIEPVYDMIIPYQQENVYVIVKKDGNYGWIDQGYVYTPGFPSPAAESWLKGFSFLPKNLVLQADSTIAFAEVPNADGAGNGIVMPPSYLVKTGLFSEVVTGISTTPMPINGWTEYVTTGGTLLQSISDKINAVMTTITERYLDGREEFYTYNRVSFVNQQQDTLAVSDIASSGSIIIKQIDSTLLELRFNADWSEGSEFEEFNIPICEYFRMGDDLSVIRLQSRRMFSFTEFVKIDSGYLTGNFNGWHEETGDEFQSNFLSLSTLNYMRNEILAQYGYRFADEIAQGRFKYADWYKPQYDKVEEFQDQMTEIDLYNMMFLDKVIALMQDKPV